jgi:hypothetical protein
MDLLSGLRRDRVYDNYLMLLLDGPRFVGR